MNLICIPELCGHFYEKKIVKFEGKMKDACDRLINKEKSNENILGWPNI